MDKTLIDYDKNLEELERQREKLEIVMQMMGQEWEESGAGIGWLGQLDLPEANIQDPVSPIPTATTTALHTITSDKLDESAESGTVAMETIAANIKSTSNEILSLSTHQPIFSNILSHTAGPSPEYLQSLLNVNEALLAQSLANNSNDSSSSTIYRPSTPMLSPAEEEYRELLLDTKLNSPVIICQQDNDDDTPIEEDIHNTPRDYMATMNPESEIIISPITTAEKSMPTLTTSSTKTSIY
ncbi:hypothetical protein BD408DRAFT_425138 [Parasitella parasitica]|nr:hypothetical protein BD408DRAFT_425138 [Parasitella parasitica]